jgi:predicted amidohydrolase YtcJ
MRNKDPVFQTSLCLNCLLTLLLLMSCGKGQYTVFYGGPILTMDQEFQSRENLCVIVKGERIESVSSFDTIDKNLFQRAKKVNLEGNLLMPGLIESHGHLFYLGQSQLGLNLRGIKTKKAVLERIREYASSLKKGQWLFGRGWDQSDWSGQQFPTAKELDQILPDNPAVLYRIGGHAAWLNSPALELAGIDAATKNPVGGKIVRDAGGQPTGILVDNAMNLVREFVDANRSKNPIKVLKAAQAEALGNGITTFHDLAYPSNRLYIYKWLFRFRILKINLHVYLQADENLTEYVTQNPPASTTNGRLTIRAIKVFYDGAMGSFGALLSEPYSDQPGNSGLQTTSDDTLIKIARLAKDNGYQLAVHAIGDLANSKTLDIFEKTIGNDSHHVYRWRIEHAQFLKSEDIKRIAENQYIPSMQPIHATSDMKWVVSRLGPERAQTTYAWRSLIEAGSIVAGGSDAPVEPINPFWGLYAAETRQDHFGQPVGGFIPQEKVTRSQALQMYTTWGAFAGFEENEIGRLKQGYRADLIILDRDVSRVPAKDLLKTRVLRTYVRGEQVFGNTDFESASH